MSSKGSLPKIIFSLTTPSSIRLLESPNKIEGHFNIDVNSKKILFSLLDLEGRSPEMNVGHVIANSRTIRDLGESSFDSAICIRTVKLKSC